MIYYPPVQRASFVEALSEPTDIIQLSRLRTGPGRAVFDRIARHAAEVFECSQAILYVMVEGQLIILSLHGYTMMQTAYLRVPSFEKSNKGREAFEFFDMTKMSFFDDAALVHGAAGWRYAISAPLSSFGLLGSMNGFAALMCVDTKPKSEKATQLDQFRSFAAVANDAIGLLIESHKAISLYNEAAVSKPLLRDSALDQPVSITSPHPVARFLDETLVRKRRLLSRGGISYLALRAWRRPIKAFQIDALRAMKENPPDWFVDQIASEIAMSVQSLHGRPDNATVVAVPCGHSGTNCLSARLARAVARILDLVCVEAFACLEVSGSSHPKTNLKRPKMKLLEAVATTVILVDDVATSGAHIAEATALLQQHSNAIWPIVWIAD